jgi:hypothetical protein
MDACVAYFWKSSRFTPKTGHVVAKTYLTTKACPNSNHDHSIHDEKFKTSTTTSRHLRERLLVMQTSTTNRSNFSSFFAQGPFWIEDSMGATSCLIGDW